MVAQQTTFYALALWALLSTSAYSDSSRLNPTADWLPADIDWDNAPIISIKLLDHSYEPDDLTLSLNTPYKLVYINESLINTHDLVSVEFFHSFVIEKIILDNELITTPHIHSLRLRPEGTLELHMVPKKAGQFDIFCSITGHKDAGMEGMMVFE